MSDKPASDSTLGWIALILWVMLMMQVSSCIDQSCIANNTNRIADALEGIRKNMK